MKKLCLLLLLVPHHRGVSKESESPPHPPTPAPHRPPPPVQPPPPTGLPERKEDSNNSNKKPSDEGTDGKPLALQDPPHRPEKRHKGQGHDPETGDGKRRGLSTDQGENGLPATAPDPPTPDPPESGRDPLGEGPVEGHPPPLPPNGHDPDHKPQGEENQGPDPDPDQNQNHGILKGAAYHLQRWEETYKQLVEDILDDLSNYWQMLGIPQ